MHVFNTVDFSTVFLTRTIDVMNFIFESLSKKYRELQNEADELMKNKFISDDQHDDLTKKYEEARTEEATLLLTKRYNSNTMFILNT